MSPTATSRPARSSGRGATIRSGMRAFAEKGLATPFKIDYFATSLPLLLIFEDDLEAVKNAQMENLKSLAGKGLSVMEGK